MTAARTKGFKDHFSALADAYSAHRPSYPRALAAWLAKLSPARDLAWDCGCGSGQLSALLAGFFDCVIATDASAEQLSRAAAHPKVRYRQARAEASGLPIGCADLIVAAQAAHWFDLPGFYSEVRRVGKPGGVVALITYGAPRVNARVDEAVARFYHETLQPYWPAERRHVEDGYRSLPFPFEEIAAPCLAIRLKWRLAELLGYIDTWSATARLEKACGRDPILEFHQTVGHAWGPVSTARVVHWPLAMRVGRLRPRRLPSASASGLARRRRTNRFV